MNGEIGADTIEAAKKYAEAVFKTDSSGHDFFHTMRVYRIASYIAGKEHADPYIVQLAALLHDPAVKPALSMDKNTYHNHTSTAINHFYEKLFYLKDMMNTDTAKRVALRREQYMKNFVTAFLNEWEMTDFADLV